MRCDLTVKYENVPRRDVVFDPTPISYYSCRHCVEKNIVPEAMQSTAIVYGKIYTVIWVCKPISCDGQGESSDGVRTIDIEKEEIKQDVKTDSIPVMGPLRAEGGVCNFCNCQ